MGSSDHKCCWSKSNCRTRVMPDGQYVISALQEFARNHTIPEELRSAEQHAGLINVTLDINDWGTEVNQRLPWDVQL